MSKTNLLSHYLFTFDSLIEHEVGLKLFTAHCKQELQYEILECHLQLSKYKLVSCALVHKRLFAAAAASKTTTGSLSTTARPLFIHLFQDLKRIFDTFFNTVIPSSSSSTPTPTPSVVPSAKSPVPHMVQPPVFPRTVPINSLIVKKLEEKIKVLQNELEKNTSSEEESQENQQAEENKQQVSDQEKVKEMLQELETVFDEAQHAILLILRVNIFPRFLHSAMFIEYFETISDSISTVEQQLGAVHKHKLKENSQLTSEDLALSCITQKHVKAMCRCLSSANIVGGSGVWHPLEPQAVQQQQSQPNSQLVNAKNNFLNLNFNQHNNVRNKPNRIVKPIDVANNTQNTQQHTLSLYVGEQPYRLSQFEEQHMHKQQGKWQMAKVSFVIEHMSVKELFQLSWCSPFRSKFSHMKKSPPMADTNSDQVEHGKQQHVNNKELATVKLDIIADHGSEHHELHEEHQQVDQQEQAIVVPVASSCDASAVCGDKFIMVILKSSNNSGCKKAGANQLHTTLLQEEYITAIHYEQVGDSVHYTQVQNIALNGLAVNNIQQVNLYSAAMKQWAHAVYEQCLSAVHDFRSKYPFKIYLTSTIKSSFYQLLDPIGMHDDLDLLKSLQENTVQKTLELRGNKLVDLDAEAEAKLMHGGHLLFD